DVSGVIVLEAFSRPLLHDVDLILIVLCGGFDAFRPLVQNRQFGLEALFRPLNEIAKNLRTFLAYDFLREVPLGIGYDMLKAQLDESPANAAVIAERRAFIG